VQNDAQGVLTAATVVPERVATFFADLGPGLITGAADDDPSGISTYSVTGASFGYGPLWTAILSFPLMVSVQIMCARLGMVTGRGLAGVIRRRYSPYLFFWQAAQEVEDERARGRDIVRRQGATDEEIRRSNIDVATGMFFSNLVMMVAAVGMIVTSMV
jgi:Mn2+/Fe2+ NRAMP family transporter